GRRRQPAAARRGRASWAIVDVARGRGVSVEVRDRGREVSVVVVPQVEDPRRIFLGPRVLELDDATVLVDDVVRRPVARTRAARYLDGGVDRREVLAPASDVVVQDRPVEEQVAAGLETVLLQRESAVGVVRQLAGALRGAGILDPVDLDRLPRGEGD